MPVAKLITRLCLFAALLCAVLVTLAVGVGRGSPSEGEIAFSSFGDIYLIQVERNLSINLTPDLPTTDFRPLWSPDGSHLVFASYSAGGLGTSIYSMNHGAGNRSIRQLASFTQEISAIVWSPDNRHIAVSISGMAYLLDVQASLLCSDTTSTPCSNPSNDETMVGDVTDWSADGDEILVSNMFSEGMNIVALDGTGQRHLFDGLNQPLNATWSPDQSLIAFTTFTERGYVVILMEDGVDNSSREITDGLPDRSSFAWSPDGSMIAFSSSTFSDSEIFSIGIQNNPATQLTENNADDNLPSWSPDGSHIAFISSEGPRYALYVMNNDGSNVHQLSASVFPSSPAWRPVP